MAGRNNAYVCITGADCLATLRAARSLYDGRDGLDTVWTRALTGLDDLRQATGCKRLSQVRSFGGRMKWSRDDAGQAGWGLGTTVSSPTPSASPPCPPAAGSCRSWAGLAPYLPVTTLEGEAGK